MELGNNRAAKNDNLACLAGVHPILIGCNIFYDGDIRHHWPINIHLCAVGFYLRVGALGKTLNLFTFSYLLDF